MGWTRLVRAAVGVVGALAVIGAVAAFTYGEPLAGVWALLVGAALVGVAVFEVGRYRAQADARPRTGAFQPTEEVFVDPTTGRRTRVWLDPATGDRRYEPET